MAFDSETLSNLPDAPQAILIVKQGAQIGLRFPVSEDLTVIGREESCDIVIQDAEASRRHCQLSWEGNAFVFRDMGSTNGSFVNGAQITAPRTLTNGDTIGVGQTTLVLEIQQMGPMDQTEYGVSNREYAASENPSGVSGFLSNPTQKWLLGGCGCLLLLCICTAVLPLVLQSLGIINLTDINQLLGL